MSAQVSLLNKKDLFLVLIDDIELHCLMKTQIDNYAASLITMLLGDLEVMDSVTVINRVRGIKRNRIRILADAVYVRTAVLLLRMVWSNFHQQITDRNLSSMATI